MTYDKLSLCEHLFWTSLLFLTGLKTPELKRSLGKRCLQILEHTLRWASWNSSWVWATNSDPMLHQRFLYFSCLFFLPMSAFAVESCLCHSMIISLKWGQRGATYSCWHCSPQPWETMSISNNAPNYINVMLNFPSQTYSRVMRTILLMWLSF